jgi:hypothetical protein
MKTYSEAKTVPEIMAILTKSEKSPVPTQYEKI